MGFNFKNKWGYDLDIEVFVFGHNVSVTIMDPTVSMN